MRQSSERTGETKRYPAQHNKCVALGMVNVGIRNLFPSEGADKLAVEVPLGCVASLELHSGGDHELDGSMSSETTGK